MNFIYEGKIQYIDMEVQPYKVIINKSEEPKLIDSFNIENRNKTQTT